MRIATFAVLAALSAPALSQELDQLGNLAQGQFRALSEDLGGALSYRPMMPTEPLGVTGFDIGLGITAARIDNEALLELASSDDAPRTLPIPTLRAHKGLPLGIDVGVMYAQVPDSDIRFYGGELKWAFVQGGTALPAIGIRGAFTKVSGVDQLDFSTRSLDLSISKGFANLTPYAGIGRVWVKSEPKGVPTLAREKFELDKVFVGLGINLGVMNLNLEADQTGDVTGLSAKLGVRF